jgi:tRNA nucleotidyltransferase (CCA-adding enzyme)
MLLSVLPTLMRGHVDEREKITARTVDSAADNADVVQLTSADSRLLYLCVFILPFHDLTFTNKKGQEVFVTAHMVKEAIKFPLRDTQAVSKILSHVDELVTILSEFCSQLANDAQLIQEGGGDAPRELTPPCRLRVGLLLRSLKEHWVTCLITAAAWEIRTYPRPHEGDNDRGIATSSVPEDLPSRELFRVIVDDLDLDGCWRVRPHLNGKDLIKELDLQNGPLVGVYTADQTRWILSNPHGTREQCVTHLRDLQREREGGCIGSGVEAQGVSNSSPVTKSDKGAKHSQKKFRVEN